MRLRCRVFKCHLFIKGVGWGGGDNFHFMVSTTSDLISRYTCRQFVE